MFSTRTVGRRRPRTAPPVRQAAVPVTPPGSVTLEGSETRAEARRTAAVDGVVLERRERAFWQRKKSSTPGVSRDPYFVIDLDTGNS